MRYIIIFFITLSFTFGAISEELEKSIAEDNVVLVQRILSEKSYKSKG